MIEFAAAFVDKLGMDILARTYEHVYLTVIALALAVAIALPLGVMLARIGNDRVSAVVLAAASVIQTVPSLALIAFIVLIFALVSLPAIGTLPALVALVLYALLPILRNTYTGIRQVDPALVEVAEAMGMTRWQILFKVELPIALPVVMAGVRISAVWTIGVATLCTLVGAGGLGDLILQGLRTISWDYLAAGTVPAAALALIVDGLLAALERWLTPEGMR